MASAFSPSSSNTAISVLAATFSVPSLISNLPTTPSSTASTSIVALSVSISAMTLPGLTLSPSLTFHAAKVPSVIVGLSAGIRTLIGILSHLLFNQYIGPQLGRIGLGAGGGDFFGFFDHRFDRFFDLVEILFGCHVVFHQERLEFDDPVAFPAHLVDVVLRPVLCRLSHRVAGIAIGFPLKQDRPVPARVFARLGRGIAHGQYIHAI